MDIFFFQLAIIFLPGLIWERIVAKYGLKRPPTTFETGLRTFTFGVTSYLATFAIFSALGIDVVIPDVKKDGPFIVDRVYLAEFIAAVEISVCGAIIWLYVINKKWAGRFLRKIGATKKFGDEDIWDFAFTSDDPWAEYVYVRDYANEKVFSGWVVGFSETDKVRELLLRDVEVFDLEGLKLYNSPLMYLGRPTHAVDIEFPARGQGETNGTTSATKSAAADH